MRGDEGAIAEGFENHSPLELVNHSPLEVRIVEEAESFAAKADAVGGKVLINNSAPHQFTCGLAPLPH